MFKVEHNRNTQTIFLIGNFDSSKAEEVKAVFNDLEKSVTVDMSDLEFICSAGIGIMVMAYRSLKEKGEEIRLVNLSEHIKKVFEISLLDKIFNIC